MPLTVLLGGARSGKSAHAVRMGERWPGPVTFVATAEALDAEMADRIERHRADRPAAWETCEEPVALAEVLEAIPDDTFAIVDCLTLWVSNLVASGLEDDDILALSSEAASVAAARPARTLAISNEVGMGIVPAEPGVRRYRDLLGNVNRQWADSANAAMLFVAGRVLPLVPPADV